MAVLPERTREYLLTAMSATPLLLDLFARRVRDEPLLCDLRADGRFSVREVFAHLADWDLVFAERVKLTIEQPGAAMVTADEEEMAILGAYHAAEPARMIVQFSERRAALVSQFRAVAEDRLDLYATHAKIGRMSIEAQMAQVVGHDGYHLEYLSRLIPPR